MKLIQRLLRTGGVPAVSGALHAQSSRSALLQHRTCCFPACSVFEAPRIVENVPQSGRLSNTSLLLIFHEPPSEATCRSDCVACFFLASKGCHVEEALVGGMSAEIITPTTAGVQDNWGRWAFQTSSNGRVILYLHGGGFPRPLWGFPPHHGSAWVTEWSLNGCWLLTFMAMRRCLLSMRSRVTQERAWMPCQQHRNALPEIRNPRGAQLRSMGWLRCFISFQFRFSAAGVLCRGWQLPQRRRCLV